MNYILGFQIRQNDIRPENVVIIIIIVTLKSLKFQPAWYRIRRVFT